MEDKFGHLFDKVIVNIDLDRTLADLKDIVHKLDTRPHWVPSTWISDGVPSISGR